MDTVNLEMPRKEARDLYRKYKEHRAYSQPIDWEIQRTYQLLALGNVVIRAIEGDYYSPSLHVTQGGGIGMNVGGSVIAAKAVADTRYYEGDGHNDSGKMLAMAERNVLALAANAEPGSPVANSPSNEAEVVPLLSALPVTGGGTCQHCGKQNPPSLSDTEKGAAS